MANNIDRSSFDWKNPKWENYADLERNMVFVFGEDWEKFICEKCLTAEQITKFRKWMRYSTDKNISEVNSIIEILKSALDWKNPKWEDYADLKRNMVFVFGKDWEKFICEKCLTAEQITEFRKWMRDSTDKNISEVNSIIEILKSAYFRTIMTIKRPEQFLGLEEEIEKDKEALLKLEDECRILQSSPSHQNISKLKFSSRIPQFLNFLKNNGGFSIENLGEFLSVIQKGSEYLPADTTRFYRGQSAFYPTMEPSLFRKDSKGRYLYDFKQEYSLIQRLATEEPVAFQQDSTLFEKMVRAQHYGAPTRLLDVTTNPFVALYFACQENDKKEDGRFYTFYWPDNDIKFWNDPEVVIYSNLARLTREEQKIISDTVKKRAEKPAEEYEPSEKYEPTEEKALNTLIKFCRIDAPFFPSEAKFALRINHPIPVWPRKINQRLRAQHGAFFLCGLKQELSVSEIVHNTIVRNTTDPECQIFTIPHDSKKGIIKELETISISKETLFPELENSARAYGEDIKAHRQE